MSFWDALVHIWERYFLAICPDDDCVYSKNEEATNICPDCKEAIQAERRREKARDRYWDKEWKNHTKSPGHWH